MDIDTFFEKWQGQIETHYADHVRRPMLTDMYNDLKKIINRYEVVLNAARDFIVIDEEVHSAPCDETWNIIEERAKRYTDSLKNLKLLLKEID